MDVEIEGLGELRDTVVSPENREYLYPVHQKAGFALKVVSLEAPHG